MNIFVTDIDPVKSAQALDDKRVIKMVLESAQMLCTALHLNGASHLAKYKKTHQNHPSNVWVRETRSNYEWLLNHFKALCDEYTLRNNKIHATSLLYNDLAAGIQFIKAGPLTPFANCAARKDMNMDYKHYKNVYVAYRMYLLNRWDKDKKRPQWNRKNLNPAPYWYYSHYGLQLTYLRLLFR